MKKPRLWHEQDSKFPVDSLFFSSFVRYSYSVYPLDFEKRKINHFCCNGSVIPENCFFKLIHSCCLYEEVEKVDCVLRERGDERASLMKHWCRKA